MKALLLAALLALPAAAAPVTLRVRISPSVSQEIVEIPLEKYVAAVLAGESAVLKSDEAEKAMAVAARTFAIRFRGRHANEGYDLCGTTHCQRLELKGITPRLDGVAAATAGELLWYSGKPATLSYSADCGGVTEDATAVWAGQSTPYLKSHPDPYCTRNGAFAWHWTVDPLDILGALHRSQLRGPQSLERITIARRSASGRALDLLLEGGGEAVRISASTFRFAMGRGLGWNTVRSDRYAIAAPGGQLTFQGSGAGHGVGLCQRGADQMGIEGHLYHEILSFYYPGALPGLTAQGIPWTRMGGEAVALMTTQPEQDGAVLGLAERLVREASQRTGWLAPGGVEVRVYPDVETFRDATAEPGWVAGRTSGRRIELQPAGVLRSRGVLESTLWHEMLHVFVESQANARLPVWFREGIVEYLAGQRSLTVTASNDSAGRARLAYAAAARSVTELVARYGEVAVLSWLAAGLPRDVTNANINHPATNTR